METLKCNTCGSNRLKKEKDHYLCEYCGATLIPPKKDGGKRITLILLIVTLLTFGVFIGYRTLYHVQESVDTIKNSITVQKNQTTLPNPIPLDDTPNPYADTFKKVEATYGEIKHTDSLYSKLKSYHKKATHKAFYLALSKNGKYAIGIASGESSSQKAEEKASSLCEAEKKKYPTLDADCIPYAIDDHISPTLY
jgi:DNA-directed RNA polymerase subunit RPC12/RpoP